MAATTTLLESRQQMASAVTSALAEAGIAQRKASDLTGIPMTTLRRRLTGNAAFDLDELALLGDLVGLTIADLVARADQAA